MKLDDSCSCGAKFSAETWLPWFASETYEVWLKSHSACRAGSVVTGEHPHGT